MASPAPTTIPDTARSRSLFGCAVAFSIHTAIVYGCAIRLSPWLVYHWFGWFAPMLHVSINVPAGDWPPGDWYLQHLELATVVPALIVGYINVSRLLPASVGVVRSPSVATWAWAVRRGSQLQDVAVPCPLIGAFQQLADGDCVFFRDSEKDANEDESVRQRCNSCPCADDGHRSVLCGGCLQLGGTSFEVRSRG